MAHFFVPHLRFLQFVPNIQSVSCSLYEVFYDCISKNLALVFHLGSLFNLFPKYTERRYLRFPGISRVEGAFVLFWINVMRCLELICTFCQTKKHPNVKSKEHCVSTDTLFTHKHHLAHQYLKEVVSKRAFILSGMILILITT